MVPLFWWCCGVFVALGLYLWWCGGAFVAVVPLLWWCFVGGGVFALVFSRFCSSGGVVFALVFLWWSFRGGGGCGGSFAAQSSLCLQESVRGCSGLAGSPQFFMDCSWDVAHS